MFSFLPFALALLTGTAPAATRPTREPSPSPFAPSPFALVELFTSEGCSSCPPADELLGDLDQKSRASGQPVYTIAFHVDYWNRLGWVDRFSAAANTGRQYKYVSVLSLPSAYTPQMVVNGRAELVGSDTAAAQREIEKALAEVSRVALEASAEPPAGKTVRVNFHAAGDTEGLVLTAVLVQRQVTTRVSHGENANRTLVHTNVVRAMEQQTITNAAAHGTVNLALPDDLQTQKQGISVLTFLQNPKTLAVVAATRTDLP